MGGMWTKTTNLAAEAHTGITASQESEAEGPGVQVLLGRLSETLSQSSSMKRAGRWFSGGALG